MTDAHARVTACSIPAEVPGDPGSTAQRVWQDLEMEPSGHVLQAINDLLDARTHEDAEKAYWRIDNTAVVQGRPLEAALPTLRALLVGIHGCTDVARPPVLELLVQLASGSNVSGEDDLHIVRECRRELLYGTSYFLFLLERGTLDERAHCVDLLGLCAHADRELLPRVRGHLERAGKRERDGDLQKLIENTLLDL